MIDPYVLDLYDTTGEEDVHIIDELTKKEQVLTALLHLHFINLMSGFMKQS